MSETMSDQLATAFNKNKVNKNKQITFGLLRKWNKLRILAQGEKDGVDHINVSISAKKNTLGHFLSTEFVTYIYTPLGRYANMDIFMRYINTPGMPFSLNDVNTVKTYFKRYKRLKLKPIDVPNYWAMVTAGFICKIKDNEEMEKLLKESVLPFTSYRLEKPKSILSTSEIAITIMQDYRARYVGVIEEVRLILKRYDDLELQKIALHILIMKTKDDATKHLYDSVPFATETESSSSESTVEELEVNLREKTKELKAKVKKEKDSKALEEEKKKNTDSTENVSDADDDVKTDDSTFTVSCEVVESSIDKPEEKLPEDKQEVVSEESSKKNEIEVSKLEEELVVEETSTDSSVE